MLKGVRSRCTDWPRFYAAAPGNGSGGVAIELYRDVTHLALPVSREQVLTALERLKLSTLLRGFRGKPAADVDALIDAAVGLGDLFLSCPEITEFELNPVIVGPRGAGLRVVDALVVTANKHDNPSSKPQ